MTIDLPDRTNITHDDCSKIIEAWQNGRLIDMESIDYDTAVALLREKLGYFDFEDPPSEEAVIEWLPQLVNAALGIKETTT